MITSRTAVAGVAALALAACAPQSQPVGKLAEKETPAKPTVPKKPVRMNDRGKVSSISIEDLFPLQASGKALLYDARPAFFYHLGHIPGAVSLPKSDADARIEKRKSEIESALAAGKTIVVYCTNTLCPDARTVANHLAGYGYNSSVLGGGWEHYEEAGLPVE